MHADSAINALQNAQFHVFTQIVASSTHVGTSSGSSGRALDVNVMARCTVQLKKCTNEDTYAIGSGIARSGQQCCSDLKSGALLAPCRLTERLPGWQAMNSRYFDM